MNFITENIPPIEPSENETFGRSDLNIDTLLDEMNDPKQPFTESLNPPKPENKVVDTEPTDEDRKKKSMYAAKFIVSAFDNAFSTAAALLSLSEDKEQFQADKEEKKDITEALSEYLKTSGGDIPPGIMVAILALVIYGGKIPQIISLRNSNLKIKQQAEEIEALKHELEKQKIKGDNGTESTAGTERQAA